MYNQVANTLKSSLPNHIIINGDVYPPSSINSLLASLCSFIFIIGLILLFAGEQLFETLQIPLGVRFIRIMKENQMTTMMALLMLNYASGQLIATGAFEIQYNGELIHSKLETGRLPNMQFLLSTAHQTLNLPHDSY